MKRELRVSFRGGKPWVAYLYLTGNAAIKSARSEETSPGLVVDFDNSGVPIGLEIINPSHTTSGEINAVLHRIGEEPLSEEELAPLMPQTSGPLLKE